MVVATKPRALSGRRRERASLAAALSSGKSEFLALYGRRRVGKTFLVRRFFQSQPVHYFEMVGRFDATVAEHLRIFSESLATAFFRGAPLAPPSSWHHAFGALQKAIEGTRGAKKFVLFFDELPWIDTHRSGVLRELEHFWNAWCSRRDDILLVVCGSAASWMLKKIVHARGGLHNRLTRTLRLLPFSLDEVKAFFEDRSMRLTDRQLVELYMIFGGVPHYLDQVVRGDSVPQAVDRICLDRDGALRGELERLFAALFEDDDKYVQVVRALARRRRGLTRNELLDEVALPTGGGATTLLENLTEAGFISASIPFGRKERDRFFRLTDPFTLFHLKWMEGPRPASWQSVYGSQRWHAWAGLAFESACLENVDAIERALGISGVDTRASAWLHRDAQVDLLIDRADRVISICELKFTDGPFAITKRYADELRRKLAVFREHAKTRKNLQLVFVTSEGVAPNRYADELVDKSVTIADLFR